MPRTIAVILLLAALPLAADATAQIRDQTQIVPTNELPNPYSRVEPWGDVPTGAYEERASFIGVEEGPDGNLYVLHRCRANSCADRPEPPVLKLDASGRLLANWGAGMMDFPHGLAIDREGNVWAADQRTHQIYKWDANGRLLMTLGERGMAGDPPARLSEPTDVAVAPNGDIFVTEGHSFARGANRVSKFSADGSFLMSWGGTGSGLGRFNVPHAVALDARGRVFIADRANNRIQIFDQEGRFLDVWYQFGRPSGIAIDGEDRIYVADSESWGTDNPGWKKGIRVGSARDGSVQYLIEDLEPYAIEHSGAEGVGVDSRGNVYGAVVRRRMLERHEPDGGAGAAARAEASRASASSGPRGTTPPPAHVHIGHVATGIEQTPAGRGLLATATLEAGIALLHANFAAGDLSDLEAMRRHARHVLHTLAGEGDAGPGTGYGLQRALAAVATHAGLAAQASGASSAAVAHAGHIEQIVRAVGLRAERAVDVAERLGVAPSIREASPLVAELRLLAYQIAEGGDENGDGDLALDGEAGLQQLEAHVYAWLDAEGLPRVIR